LLSDGVAEVRDCEIWLVNVRIGPCPRCSLRDQHEPKRLRRLLLRKNEILKIEQQMIQSKLYLIPIRMFYNDKNFVKVEIGLGKVKNLSDKRDTIMKREGEREIRRVMKGGYD
jgi:SsrA-binding protein